MRTTNFAATLAAFALAGITLAGDAPPSLVGTWGTGSVSSTMFVHRATGSYSEPSGTQVQYKFLPDSRYEYAALTTQSMYSCSTRFLTFKTGVVVYRGDELFVACQGDGSVHVIDIPGKRWEQSFQAGTGCESLGFF